MTFRTDNSQTTRSFHFRTQLNVGTTTCHVGSNSHNTLLTSLCHNIRLSLMQFRIQYIMLNLAHSKHFAQHFRDFHRSGTYQNRTSFFYHFFNLFDDSFIFLTFCLINAIIHIFTGNRTIRWNNNDIQFINIPKFSRFRFRRTGHTRQFMIHTEIVLQSDGSKCLSSGFHLHPFLGLNSLMQTVRITTAFHNTSCLFVNNLNLSVNYNIFIILFEHGISLQ